LYKFLINYEYKQKASLSSDGKMVSRDTLLKQFFSMTKVLYLAGTAKKVPLIFVLFMAASVFSTTVSAQTVRGKVVDNRTGEPLVGVAVAVRGNVAQTGVATGINGEFVLNAGALPAVIGVSYIGYKSQEIDVYEISETLIIYLVEDFNLLNEIVVVGYGTQKRSELSGSIVSVPAINLTQPVTSFDNLLGGAIAGVNVVQSSGQPGASSSIRIRGGNSINGGNEPLYVIDGFIMYNDNSNVETGVARTGAAVNALSTINPADIESMEVLKDAAATAIYGSRGANGVILITTKRGKRGADAVTYSASFGWAHVSKKLDMLNAGEWAKLRNDISASTGAAAPDFTSDEIEALGAGADWQSAALQTGFTQNHQVSVAGGDDKTQYTVSGNYYDQEGILLNTQFQRYTLRSNLSRTINTKLRIGLNLVLTSVYQAGVGVVNGTTSPDTFSSILLTPPAATIYNEDGSYNFDNPYLVISTGGFRNPIADLNETTNETKIKRSLGNFYAEYKLLPELTAKLSGGADLIHTKQNYYSPLFTEVGQATTGLASIGSRTVNSWQAEFTLTYDRTFNRDHNINILGGYTTQKSDSEGVTAVATHFVNDIVGFNSLGSGLAGDPSSSAVTSVLNSWLGRVNYSYLKRYNASVSFRADGSSRFLGVNNKQWGYFPSVGLSWNVNEESFLKSVEKLGSLKVRLSAGTTGNQEIGDYRAYSLQSPINYSFNRQIVTGYVPANMANPDLKWEETTQYNAGFDLGVLDERITLNFDAYYKKTNDLLVNAPVETAFGHESILRNIGSISNKGVEVQISADAVRGRGKAFNWRSSFVFARNINEVLSLGDNVDKFYPQVPSTTLRLLEPLIVQTGQPLGTFWGYKTDGIVQSGDDLSRVAKPSWISGSVQPGDRKYVNVKDDDNVINADDKVFLGSSQPKFTFGFTNTFSYKGLDLLAVIQGSYGNKIYNALKAQLEITTLFSNTLASALDRWTPDNPSKDVPRATSSPATVVSDRYVEDGSYVRLKNLTLGYTLPVRILSPAKIAKARVFLTAQNLFTLTRYSGYDPEASTYEQNNLLQGIDYGAYPSSKTFLVGVELSF
jgi:TonB-linked SusC/RagA family outer membrane protein